MGPPGASDSAGWVGVRSFNSGSVTDSSANITQANVVAATANAGVLCFYDLPFVVHALIATPTGSYGYAEDNLTIVSTSPNAIAQGCPGGMDFDHSAFVTGYYDVNGFNGGPRPATEEGVTVVFF